jgi:hypothetical protein
MVLKVGTQGLVLLFSWLPSTVIAVPAVNVAEKGLDKTTLSSPTNISQQVTVTKVEFGVFRKEKNGNLTLIPTRKVPLQEGVIYGWRLQLHDYNSEVTWREILKLPKPPQTWGTTNAENFSLSADGTFVEIKRKDFPKDGVIANSWTIASGDPVGKYIMQVYIGDRHVATFEFEVVPPKKEKPKLQVEHSFFKKQQTNTNCQK